MTGKTVRTALFFALAATELAQELSTWKAASKEDKAIEFQWKRPANNSCEVSIRDLQMRTKTTLTTTVQYLPHKAAKQAFEMLTAEVIVQAVANGLKHIANCEQVISVGVSRINRE